MNLVVTTAHAPSAAMTKTAFFLAGQLAAPFKARAKLSLAAIGDQFHTDELLVVTKDGPVVYTPEGKYFFHLNMAELRIKNILNGKHDHMVAAMDLQSGMSVLDCTLGLATDAIVASFVTGEAGTVHGLEASPVIAAITGWGIRNFTAADAGVFDALRRITVENADYNLLLPTLPDNCYDVVFFDPMFRIPVTGSSHIIPLRYLADDRPLSPSAIKQACRVAKKRVVIKETNGSTEFSRLNIMTMQGGKYSSIQYGIIEVEDAKWNA